MKSNDADDAVLRILEELPALTPDSARAERIRARCHGALARRRRRLQPSRSTGFAGRLLGPVLVGGLCVVYFLAVIGNTLRLHGVW